MMWHRVSTTVLLLDKISPARFYRTGPENRRLNLQRNLRHHAVQGFSDVEGPYLLNVLTVVVSFDELGIVIDL